MPSKDAKTKARTTDSKSNAESDKVYAGGNPGFDERKPTATKKPDDTVHAGVNPQFDERQTGK
jgi:hypothetical protein